jgi:hypothetical protein
MDDHTGRLVDHDQVRVLVQHRERHVGIRNRVTRRRLAGLDLEPHSPAHLLLRATDLAVDLHSAFVDPALNGGARNLRHQARQRLVHALGCLTRRQLE